MKIRNGFVTNSSSSSFILAFKNENDIKNIECTGEYFKRLYDDCTNKDNQYDIDYAIDYYLDGYYYEILYELDLKIREKYQLNNKELEQWEKDNEKEYAKLIDEQFTKEKEILKEKLMNKDIICILDYGDDSLIGEKLEQDIVPNLKECVQVLNFH